MLAGAAIVVVPLLAGQPASNHATLDALADEFATRTGLTAPDPEAPLVSLATRLVSETAAREEARWAAGFRSRVEAIDPASLDTEDWISRAVLLHEAGVRADRGAWFWHEMAMTPYASPLRQLQAAFGAAPLATPAQRQRYLDGLRQLRLLVGAMEVKARGQADRNIVLPRAAIDLVVPYLRGFAVAPGESPFAVVASRFEAAPADARTTFAEAVDRIIVEEVSPAFEHLAAYLDGEYRSRAGEAVGVGRYPDGADYYRFLIRLQTGLDLSPAEIHQIGLDEVARLERDLDEVRRQTGFSGTLAEFRTFLKTDARFFPAEPEQMGEALMRAADRIEPTLADWFSSRPTAGYGTRRLSSGLEASMTYGYYQVPTAADARGYYLFNGSTLDERSMLNAAALSYHELVPGHHFQIVLTRENTRLPAFRQQALTTAYIEGWGEYASDLAGEMGMYADPYDRAGRLAMDLFLTTRLVVDTGMNALGWSRERAMQFMRDHTLESDAQILTESLRYSTDIPAQALAYKLGSRTIRQLRERMRTALGPRFDVKAFHQAVIGHGPMPLGVLEQHVARTLGVASEPGTHR